MKAIVRGCSAAARRFPLFIVLAALVLTGVLGSFAGQVEIATGNEGFAPDNAEIAASEQISDLFGSDQEAVLQIIIRDPGGDVISAEGVRVSMEVEEAIRRVAGDDLVADSPQRQGVVSYTAPVLQAAMAQQLPLSELSDGEVEELYLGALEEMPAEQRGFLSGLVGTSASGATAESAIILAFFEGASDTVEAFEAQVEIDEAISGELEAIDTDLEIRPFSFNLLFAEIDSFTEEVGRLFAFAGIIIVVILIFVYWLRPRGSALARQAGRRTLADMGLTMATIFMAIGMMQGTGVLLEKAGVISAFSAPTQIVPILIIGLGVDYAIHLISRYREEVGEGDTVDGAMTVAIGTVGIALVLATLTTVIGFLTNIANPVPALADFGILAALGIFFSFLLMMTFVPSVRILLDRRAERAGRLPVEALGYHSQRLLPQMMGRTAVIAERAPYVALVTALVLGGLGYFGFTQLETRFSFTDFLPEDAPAVETLELLTSEFEGGFGEQTQVLVTAPEGEDLAEPEYWNLMVTASDELALTPSVATFTTAEGPVANVDSPVGVLRQQFAAGPESAPPPVLEAVGAAGLGPGLMADSGRDVMPIFDALGEVAPSQISGVAYRAGDRVDAVLFDIQTTAGEAQVQELRRDLDSVFAPFETAGLEAIATSQNIISDVVVNELTASQSSSLFLTLLAAGLVLVAYFWIQNRRPFLGVITIAPVVLVVLWTYGLMWLTGIPFGPVTATLAALAIGIGVPFTIHMARRFEEDRNEYDDVEDAIRSTATHTGGALAGSAFTTMAGFGILVTSSLVPFKQMGQVTVYAIGLALVASILVLPSMLVLWERWHRRRA